MNNHVTTGGNLEGRRRTDVEVLELRLLSGERPLKAFVDVRVGDWVIHDFRVVKQNGHKASVLPPQVSWKDPKTGALKFKGVFTLPPELKQRIEIAVLSAFQGKMEIENDRAVELKDRGGRSCRACLKPVLIAGRNRLDELDVVGGRDSLS